MKPFYIILILLYSTFTQTNTERKFSGVVTYNFVQNTISKAEREKSKELNEFLDKMNKISEDLKFKLEFNTEASLFYLSDVMDSDFNPMAVSYVNNLVSRGMYYFNKTDDILLQQESSYGNNTLVKSKLSELNDWTLVNESKIIDEYRCYKAIRSKINQSMSKAHEFIVEAWYCPEIAVSFGPKDFNGLPSLILELKDTHYTFYANSIKIEANYKLRGPQKKNEIQIFKAINLNKEQFTRLNLILVDHLFNIKRFS